MKNVCSAKQLKEAIKNGDSIRYVYTPHDPMDESFEYVGPVNDDQSDGYYGCSTDEINDMPDNTMMSFDLDYGVEYYYLLGD